MDEITTGVGTAVRIEVREADGSMFADIATPRDRPSPTESGREAATARPVLTGAGFHPGEDVALAYVVVRQTADMDGTTAINLPPALVMAARKGLVLLGLSSLTVAPFEGQA